LLFSHLKWKRICAVVVLTAALSGPSYSSDIETDSDTFPVYPCIQPNVTFWTKIYTRYSSDQGVIHDKIQMDRIYGVIELVDPDQAGGRKINQQRIKNAKKNFKAILAKLMEGKPPAGPVEQQVAELFGPDAGPADFRSAMRNIRCQVGQKDRFQAGLIRSGAYIDEIKQIFRNAGLPEDLAYLPHVESSFNPKAYSKFGAAGMWQFTRSTGRRFMKVDYTIDERRDPILSSRAAVQLLDQNYRKLKEWSMAITAYNHGTTGMLRAQRKKGGYERIFQEYRSRIFKFASRNFYSEFLAAREAAKNYRQHFGDIKLDTPAGSQEIELAGYVPLPEVARHLNLDLAELQELNPALREPVFRGQKYVPAGYRLRLPARDDQDWEPIIARLPETLYRHNQKHSRIYTVRQGDTAGKVAKMHAVKLDDLIAANNLDQRATIYVNQNLRIPLPDEQPILLASLKNPVQDAQPASPPSDDLNALAVAAPDIPLINEKSAESVPEIGPGENGPPTNPMAEFMLAQGMVSEDRPENNRDSAETEQTELAEDEPAPDSSAEDKFQREQTDGDDRPLNPEIMQGHFAVERVGMQNGKTVGIIRVEAEETLGHYAEWLNVSAREIRQLNGFQYGRPLNLSQEIKIPLTRVTKEHFEEQRFEFHQELAEDFFTTYRVERIVTYKIKKGDNIWTLARQEFEVPLWLISRYNNGVDFSALIPSQKLLIPIVEKNV
jgi:membrane-bound lytic murein transglycosylase D